MRKRLRSGPAAIPVRHDHVPRLLGWSPGSNSEGGGEGFRGREPLNEWTKTSTNFTKPNVTV